MKLENLIKHYEILRADNDDVNIGYVINNLKEFKSLNIPCVDEFIADWYEKYKDNFEYSLWEWIRYEHNRGKNNKFYLWLNDASNNPVETLIKMKLFGYKVKGEKKYIIRTKGVYHSSNCLNYYGDEARWIFVDDIESGSHRTKHTKKQLKDAGFGWVFNCPGIEVEEVEE